MTDAVSKNKVCAHTYGGINILIKLNKKEEEDTPEASLLGLSKP